MTEHSCTGCDVPNRRDFILDALRASAAVIATLSLSSTAADAMSVRVVSALSASGSEKSYALPPADAVNIDKDNEVILARVGKKVYAFALSCPHQNTMLRWESGDNRFKCPKHKSIYTPDGVFVEGRATRGMDRYAVKLAGTNIVVDIDKLYQEDTNKSDWQQALITLA